MVKNIAIILLIITICILIFYVNSLKKQTEKKRQRMLSIITEEKEVVIPYKYKEQYPIEEIKSKMPDFSKNVRIVELPTKTGPERFLVQINKHGEWIDDRPWPVTYLFSSGLIQTLSEAIESRKSIIKYYEDQWINENIPYREIIIDSNYIVRRRG